MKTISEILTKAKKGDRLTDGTRTWKVIIWDGGKLAIPLRPKKNNFELWGDCKLEQVAIIPGLRII